MMNEIIDTILTIIRAAIYGRYSSDLQEPKSITDQISECKKHAAKNNMSTSDKNFYTDFAISGSELDRPGLLNMLDDMANGCFDVILVDDLSRISRDAKQLLEIVEKANYYGVPIISVSENINTSDESSRLLYQIKAVLNEQFLVDLKAKTIRGQKGCLEKGYNVGSLPLGYTTVPDGKMIIKKGRERFEGRKIIIDENDSNIVVQLFKDFADGISICEIVRRLNEAHTPSNRNPLGTWAPSTIYQMLRNERFIGKWDWGKKQTKRNPETKKRHQVPRDAPLLSQTFEERRIISDELWEKVQARLKEVGRIWPGGKRQKGFQTQKGSRVMAFPQHLLEGAMTCSLCGSTIGMVSGRHGGYYGCMNAKKARCENRLLVRKEIVEDKILSTIIGMLDNTECLHDIFKRTEAALKELINIVPADIKGLENNLKEINRQISNLVKFIAGTDDPTGAEIFSVRQSLREYQEQKITLENNLLELKFDNSITYEAPSMDWIRERVLHLKETLEVKTEKSALLLRSLLGPISIEPVMPEIGKPYLNAVTKLRAWTLLKEKRASDEAPFQIEPLGSTSFVWRPRDDSNVRPLP